MECKYPRKFLWLALTFAPFLCVSFAQDQFTVAPPAPVEFTKEGSEWAQQTLAKLTLEEKVGQMVQLRYFADYKDLNGNSYRFLREQLQKYHIGSVAFNMHFDKSGMLRCSALDTAIVANQLQRDSNLPLLLAADFERGVASRLLDVPDFPWPMAFGAVGDTTQVEHFGAITGREARAVGVHWAFAPVADVNSNPANPVINVRSFGSDPRQVGNMVSAFVRGAHENGLLVTAKHFPGHGDSTVDSHRGVPVIEGDLAHLQKIELPPFQAAIGAGVDSILLAHARVPALEPDSGKIVTTSSNVVTELLKNKLMFRGVILTDALNMPGLTKLYDAHEGNPTARAAVDAIKAGTDVIMWPTDLDSTFHAIIDSVRSGEIPESRIDESVLKILEMKAAVGLYKSRFVDVDQATALTSKPEDSGFAQSVADDAITLVRDNRKVLPLHRSEPPTVGSSPSATETLSRHGLLTILLSQVFENTSGKEFEKALKSRSSDATVIRVDRRTAKAVEPEVLKAVNEAEEVVVVAYVVPREAKQVMVGDQLVDSFGLLGPCGQLLQHLLAVASEKTVVVALGSPYLIGNFPQIQIYICTFAIASTSEISVAKALFGEIQNHAKLPVTLQGVAPLGFALPWPSAPAQQERQTETGPN